MARWIKYKVLNGESLIPLRVPYDESLLDAISQDAYNGEYEITPDDGLPEAVRAEDDIDNMLVDHEMRLTMIELGV